MKHSNTRKSIVHRILTGALSVVVLLSGLVFAPIPVRAAGTATTHYEFTASGNSSVDFAELKPNLTVGSLAGTDDQLRSSHAVSFSFADGTRTVNLLKIFANVSTRDAANPSTSVSNSLYVDDERYHFGLEKYRTYYSGDDYTGSTYFKVPAESLYLLPQSFEPLSTSGIEAANLSLLVASPKGADDLNIAFARQLEVKVSLDNGSTWQDESVGVRAATLLAGQMDGDLQLFRIETEDLLGITGVAGDTITNIKIYPEGEDFCSRNYFYINQILVNTYQDDAAFVAAVPEESVDYVDAITSGDTVRQIVLAEAIRTAKTKWTNDVEISTTSAEGSSGVAQAEVAFTYPIYNGGISFLGTRTYYGPVYERLTDSSRERFWSLFDDPTPNANNTHSGVSAPIGKYTSADLIEHADGVAHPYGMDCQAFVYNAISRVSRSNVVRVVSSPRAAGASLLGDLVTKDNPVFTDQDIIQLNDANAVYEAYALAQTGDILFHNLSNSINTVHTRLVRSVNVVRNGGVIDANESTITFAGQEAGAGARDGEATITGIYSSTTIETEETFASLLSDSYVVATLEEYESGEVENVDVQTVFGLGTAGVDSITEGGLNIAASSNYRIISYQVTLTKNGAAGNLFDSGLIYAEGEGPVSLNYRSNELDALLGALPAGSYQVNLTVNSGPLTSTTNYVVGSNLESYSFTVTDDHCPGHSGTALSGAATTLSSGNYYLSGNVTGTITVPTGVTATLCLNGNDIVSGSGPAIEISGGTLNLCGCGTPGSVTGASDSSAITLSSGTLNLYQGVLVTGSDSTGVYASVSTFNMYGGAIANNTASEIGGGVYLSNTTFTMSGGTICGNTANKGGGVYVDNSGTFKLSGGAVTNNTGSSVGAGVFVNGSGNLNMTGGAIAGSGNLLYFITNAARESQIKGGTVRGTVAISATTMNSSHNSQVTVSGDAVVDGQISAYDSMTISGGTFLNDVVHQGASEEIVISITGGEFKGAVKEGASYTYGRFAITGGKYSDKTDRDTLIYFLDTETDIPYYVADIDEDGLKYEVMKGFVCSGAIIDFGSSLNVYLPLFGDNGVPVDENYTISVDNLNKDAKPTHALEEITLSQDVGSMQMVAIRGIAAKEMHDDITIEVTKAGEDVVYYEDTLSIYDLAQEWVGLFDEKGQTMLADMINYGIEAQKVFDYRDDDVDNLTLNGELVGGTSETPVWEGTTGAGVDPSNLSKNMETALLLRDKVQLDFYIKGAGATITDGVKFSGITYADTNYSVSNYTVASGSTGTRINFPNINVTRVKDVVEFTVLMGDEETSFAVKYSIADYVVKALKDNDTAQDALLIAMQKYVDSVCAYLNLNVSWVQTDLSKNETLPFDWDSIVAD